MNTMKNLLLPLLVVLMFFSCSAPSNEQKAQNIIEKNVKERLYSPKSYKFGELSLDSCFADEPEKSPQYLTLAIEAANLYKGYKHLMEEAEMAEEEMSIFEPRYGIESAFSKHEYNKYKKDYDLAMRKADEKKQEIINKYRELHDIMKEAEGLGHEHSGWMVAFAYSAENMLGMPISTCDIYFLDKDFSTIIDCLSEKDMKIMKDDDVADMKYELEEEIQAVFAE